MIHLSIIIPAYRSAGILRENLPVLLSWLETQPYSHEVIVVDDGSDDQGDTAAVCRELGCVCQANPVNMGKGAAVRRGMTHARGRYRLFTDADIPYDNAVIARILADLESGSYDLVVGDRNLKDSAYFLEIPLTRRITSVFFTWFVGTIVTTNYFDTQCGIKGFRAETADFLFTRSQLDGFAFDVELLYVSLKNKFRIGRVPVRLRNQAESTVRVFRHGIAMFLDLFRIKINNMKGLYR